MKLNHLSGVVIIAPEMDFNFFVRNVSAYYSEWESLKF